MTSSDYFEDTRIPREKLTRYEEFTTGEVNPHCARFSRFLAQKLGRIESIDTTTFLDLMEISLREIETGSVSAPKELVVLNSDVYNLISNCLPLFAHIGFSPKFTLDVAIESQERMKWRNKK